MISYEPLFRTMKAKGITSYRLGKMGFPLSNYYAMKLNHRPNARGGCFKAAMGSGMQFIWQGEKTPATPDGRKAWEELAKNASPAMGRDKNGVTAMLKSALRVRPCQFLEALAVDIMLHPSAVSGEEGLAAMKALLKAYMDNDGMSIQFNVFNAATLRDAQIHPEKYRNLQVRVTGWNVLWNSLSKKEQDAYIVRCENIS